MASTNPSYKLFTEFAKSSLNDWYTLAKQTLKPDEFLKLNEDKILEGLPVKPFYASNSLKKKTTKNDVFSYTSSGKPWVFQEIVHLPDRASCRAANQTAIIALQNSVESLVFDISDSKPDEKEINNLLEGIYRDAIDISWILSSVHQFSDLGWLNTMAGVIYLNPIENYMTQGHNYQEGMLLMQELLKANLSTYKCLGISGYQFANCGATIIQEVAYTCNLLVAYLDHFTDKGVSPQVLFENLEITLSTRSSYLADIAKFRAMTQLTLKIAEAYQTELDYAVPIRALSANYNKVYYDENTNLLRNTTEALGAVLGNCQKICLVPHNIHLRKNDAFGKRMARNVAHLLRYESHLDLVHDPLAGAYAIEGMTDEIVKQAWTLFLQVEEKGGLLASFEEGSLQQFVNAAASEYLHKVATLKKTSVGANRFVPSETKPIDELRQLFPPITDQDSSKLTEIKGASVIENLRRDVDLKVAAGITRPVVGVVRFSSDSSPAIVAARLSFVKDIFLSFGVDTVFQNDLVYINVHNPQELFKNINAIVVIGDNQAYQNVEDDEFRKHCEEVPVPLLIAGLPDSMVQKREKLGIYSFVHEGMDVPAFGKKFLSDIKFFGL